MGQIPRAFDAYTAGDNGFVFQPRFNPVGDSRRKGNNEAGRFRVS